MPAPTEIKQGEKGQDELDQFQAEQIARNRERFFAAQQRKEKRARGHYRKYLNLLRGNTALAFIELPRDLFNKVGMNSCQLSFDQNASKLDLDVRRYSVYEHIDMQRLLVDWDHPEVGEQYDAWVLKNTTAPHKAVSTATQGA